MVGSQLRANAGAWGEFTADHFAFEPFSQLGGVPAAKRVFGGQANLDDLLESLNAAIFVAPDDIRPRHAGDQTVTH